MQKAKSENNLEKQTFNMNLLNENIIVFMRQQCHHSSFWHGRRVFKHNEHYFDLWITVGISTATQLLQTPLGMTKLPESSSESSSTMAAAS